MSAFTLAVAVLLVAGVLFAVFTRRPGLAAGAALLGSTVQQPVFGEGTLLLKVSELVYLVFFVSFLPPSLLVRDPTGRLRWRRLSPDALRMFALLGVIAISYPVHWIQHSNPAPILAFSLMHFTRFSALIFSLFLFDYVFRRCGTAAFIYWIMIAVVVSASFAIVGYFLGFWVSVDVLNHISRARGTFVNGNQLASFMVCCFPFLLAGWRIARRTWHRVLALLSTVVLVATVFMSESKMGVVVLTVDMLLIPWFFRRTAWTLAGIGAMGVLGAIALFVLNLGQRFLKIFSALAAGEFLSTEEAARFMLWMKGVDAVRHHWLFGTGFFTTKFFSTLNYHGKFYETYHSFYLDFFSSNGIVAFILLLVYVFSPLRDLRRSPASGELLARAAALAIINIMVMIFFENYLLNVLSQLFLGASIAIIRIKIEGRKEDVRTG